jgi:dienelactone hydrolase
MARSHSLRLVRAVAGALLAALALPAALAALPAPGWERLDVPSTGSYLWRYVPGSLSGAGPFPAIVFLHGAGSNPDVYRNYVSSSAETAGTVLILPKSLGASWGSAADETTLVDGTALVAAELPLDANRLGIAGHSAGGAYAYLVAYDGAVYSSVFTLAASYYPVAALGAPGYKPPIRMFYGTTDPNYTGGAYASLKAQWDRLGVPWEEDVQAGFGHNSWPNSAMKAGFQFLAAHARPATPIGCQPAADALCLLGGVTWEAGGAQGRGTVVPLSSDGSGLFWFFSADNWELMVKVLDGCALNQRFWVFSAATTDVRYRLTVTDTRSGRVAVYENAAGTVARAVTDTSAFETCP